MLFVGRRREGQVALPAFMARSRPACRLALCWLMRCSLERAPLLLVVCATALRLTSRPARRRLSPPLWMRPARVVQAPPACRLRPLAASMRAAVSRKSARQSAIATAAWVAGELRSLRRSPLRRQVEGVAPGDTH
ncbi:hypothetical protein FQR65_LT18845 [Abscondita terminalis]|nr:hypothetical protein FQR65_LT18845 [Abscondita terminalis]